jgi:hypothetical protein
MVESILSRSRRRLLFAPLPEKGYVKEEAA